MSPIPLSHTTATPGRLNDLLMNGILTVKTVTYLVSFDIDLCMYSICIASQMVVIRFTFGSRPSYSVRVSITHRKQCVIKTCTEWGRPGTEAKLEYSSVFFEALSTLHCLAMLSPLASLSAYWCTRFWMRLTACWTWGSSLRSERSCWTSDQTDKQS